MMQIALGILGMFLIVVAFVLDEFYKKFNQNTVQYNVLNILGSALLIYYAWWLQALPFIILNGVWCIAALMKLVKIYNK